MRIPPSVLGITLALTLAASARVAAQTIVVPEFSVANPAHSYDVAAAHSGLYFIYTATEFTPEMLLQRLHESTIAPPRVVNAEGTVYAPMLATVDGIGLIAVWHQDLEGVSRLLDPLGAPAGLPSQFTRSDLPGSGMDPRVAGLASGTAIVWMEPPAPLTQDVLKARIADRVLTLSDFPSSWAIASTPSGGCVIAWRFQLSGDVFMHAQVFDADGFAVTPQLPLSVNDFVVNAVAMSPLNGDMAIVGTRFIVGSSALSEIVAFRFDAAGAALGPALVLGIAQGGHGGPPSFAPDAVYDFAGNLYVAWTDHRSSSSTRGNFARALDPAGVPFGPAVRLSAAPGLRGVKVDRLPDGRFVNAWVDGATLAANVVSLCPAGSATCGDGILHPACERCDDGPANDDTTPDACRTDCLPAHCGDGTIDAGEACDDGNFVACDGCSPACTVETGFVCGDGILAPGCAEQCDDTNATLLDGCTPACLLERIAGGSGSKHDCLAEWSIDNPTNAIPYAKRGGITATQRCVDNDLRCDFDGGIAGSCTFHVHACANNTDLAGCVPPPRLASWEVAKPSEKQAASDPALATIRTTLLGNVPAEIVGGIERDLCTGELPIVVPLRSGSQGPKARKVTIQTRATGYDGTLDKDKLVLRCDPAS